MACLPTKEKINVHMKKLRYCPTETLQITFQETLEKSCYVWEIWVIWSKTGEMRILQSMMNVLNRQIIWQNLKTSAFPRYGSKKYLVKPTEFVSLTNLLLQFHEIFQWKCECSNSPIHLRLLFYDIYVGNSLCNGLRCQ